jgi:hypothetical protein
MTMERGSERGWTRACVIALTSLLAVVSSGWLHAQAPATGAQSQPQTRTADRLPVRRVVLYKSGIGYFEHLGKVRGSQNVAIDFTSGQLDDVLKSLTTLDLDGGRVSGVSYNSSAALDRQLGGLRLPLGQQATRGELLNALRGARIEVRGGAAPVIGRLLSVERVERRRDGTTTEVDAVSVVSDGGEISSVALDPGISVRILETDLSQEVGRYLTLVGSERNQDVRRLTIATAGAGERDLFVSYVSEVPVWKATYRIVLPSATETRKPLLQGWAIVDNTGGEDWDNVQLSLVAGAPQSFIQNVSRPLYVQRPVVPLPERMLLSPQTHQSALATAGAGVLAGTVYDINGGLIPGVTVRVSRNGAAIGTVVTDASGRYRQLSLAPGPYDVTFSLAGFRTETRTGVDVSGGMESVLNATMRVGSTNETVSVVAGLPAASPALGSTQAPAFRAGVGGGGGGRGGAAGRSDNMMIDGIAEARAAQQFNTEANQLGDLFEYKLKEPVTIRKNQSALVPILGGEVTVDKVSLWNAGNTSTRPLRAVWVQNTTGLTLDAGSFSVIEGQAFAGEGLMDSLKAGERRLLSYALDLGVTVDSKGENVPTRVTKVQVARGVVIQQTEDRQKRVYTARNEDTEPRVLIVEHPARTGWTIGGTLTPVETTPAWHRFRLPVAPKTTATFTVEEVRAGQSQFAVNSITDEQVTVLVRNQSITPAVEAQLREVLRRKADIARLATEVTNRQGEIDAIGRDQQRVRENMQALKGSAEEKQLVQRYVKQLDDQENRLQVLRKELQSFTDQRQKAQADLASFIESLAG